DKMLLMNAHGNGVVLDEEQLLFLAGEQVANVDDAVDDEAPTTQTMFMYHEVHEMQNDVQHNYFVDSNAEYTSDSNIILYNQYLEDNEENGGVQSRLANKPDMIINDSVTSELARYKELVEEYEKRAKFEFPEQIFWSIDDNNRKKAETSVPKPISA
ncbi:hypothetical protein Tco_0136875, partial [Tanacetum coccineum]